MKIALVGYSRTGKDEVAKIIRNSAVEYYSQIGFGDALKDSLYDTFPHLKHGIKARREMEIWGQMHREIDPDHWIKRFYERMKLLESYDTFNFIVNDCRQPNEASFLRSQGFIIIRVDADVNIRKERAGNEVFYTIGKSEDKLHEIEWDYKITNNGTLSDLYNSVILVLKQEGVKVW